MARILEAEKCRGQEEVAREDTAPLGQCCISTIMIILVFPEPEPKKKRRKVVLEREEEKSATQEQEKGEAVWVVEAQEVSPSHVPI